METDVIDLEKLVPFNVPNLIQKSFIKPFFVTSKITQITYQQSQPINFYIYCDYVQQDIKLKRIQQQFTLFYQHIIPNTQDFYLGYQDLKKFFELFLSFIYFGKVEYRIRDHFLPLLKLAIYFQCDILIACLINQKKQQGMIRTFFLNFLCDIYDDQNHLKTFSSIQNSQAFIQKLILQNSPSISGHTEWHQHNRKEAQDKIQKAFSQINPKLFLEFSNTFDKNNQQHLDYLLQFLYYIEKYQNPQINILEDMFLGKIFDLVDEKFYNVKKEWFTDRCKTILEKPIKKIINQPFHLHHQKTCDLVNKSFQATCSHQICLNCFFQYLIYRSKFKQLDINVPQKIRCFTRFINKDICDCVFQDQDFLQLKDYKIDDLLNLYLQTKI